MKKLFLLLVLVGCKSNYYAFFPDNHGEAKVSIDLKNKTLDWSVEPKNIDGITAMHIHCSPSEKIGVSFSTTIFNLEESRINGTALTPDKGNMCGWLTFEDVKDAIDKGDAYINIHTFAHPAGAYRAKLEALNMRERFMETWYDIRH